MHEDLDLEQLHPPGNIEVVSSIKTCRSNTTALLVPPDGERRSAKSTVKKITYLLTDQIVEAYQ